MGLPLWCRRYIFLGSSLHLELVHSLTSLRNVDLVVVLHCRYSPFVVFRESQVAFPWKTSFLSVSIVWPNCFFIWMEFGGKTGSKWKRTILWMKNPCIYHGNPEKLEIDDPCRMLLGVTTPQDSADWLSGLLGQFVRTNESLRVLVLDICIGTDCRRTCPKMSGKLWLTGIVVIRNTSVCEGI